MAFNYNIGMRKNATISSFWELKFYLQVDFFKSESEYIEGIKYK